MTASLEGVEGAAAVVGWTPAAAPVYLAASFRRIGWQARVFCFGEGMGGVGLFARQAWLMGAEKERCGGWRFATVRGRADTRARRRRGAYVRS